MRKNLFLFSVFFCMFLSGHTKFQKNNEYFFYENKGQIIHQDERENKGVKYLFHSAGLNVKLRSNGFSYDVYESKTITPSFNKGKEHDIVKRRF